MAEQEFYRLNLVVELHDHMRSALERTKITVRKMEEQTHKARQAVEKLDRVTLKNLTRNIESAGKKFGEIGQKMSMSITAPVVGFGVLAVRSSMQFGEAMANVATLIPRSTDRINELKKSILDMSVPLRRMPVDLSEGLYQVISAFGDTADTVKILELNAKAATAGVATTLDAINLTSAVTKAYGDTTAVAVGKVSDLAFTTVKLGQTTFPELAASIGMVSPLASSLGVKMEELFGVLATGTGVTGKASEVSTQLRRILQALMAPSKEMSRLIKMQGFKTGETMLQTLGLQKTINLLVSTSRKSNIPLQSLMGSIEGQTLALALAGPQATTFTEKLRAMTNVAGATEEAFREQTGGINKAGDAWKEFNSQLEVTKIKIGDELAPVLSDLLNSATILTNKFTQLSPEMQKFVFASVAIAAAMGPVLWGISQLITFVGSLSRAAVWLSLNIGKAAASLLQFKNILTLPLRGSFILAAIGMLVDFKVKAMQAERQLKDLTSAWTWFEKKKKKTPLGEPMMPGKFELRASKLSWFERNPVFKKKENERPPVDMIMRTPGTKIPVEKHAIGGILTRPHLGMVAEAGPEAVIPLSSGKRSQAIDLFKRTGQMLGLSRIRIINALSAPGAKNKLVVNIQNMIDGAQINIGGITKGNVADWLTKALRITNTPLSWLPGLQKLVQTESGGNPLARNPQSVGREHATGLLQTLPSTFRQYAVKGLGEITDPVANSAAAINYIKSRYKSVYNTPLFRGGGYVGYAQGGILTRPHLGMVAEAGPEAVIPLSSRLRSRALDIFQRTGQTLGIPKFEFGGFTGSVPAMATGDNGMNINIAGINVNISGNEIDEDALALRIGRQIVTRIKRAYENRA